MKPAINKPPESPPPLPTVVGDDALLHNHTLDWDVIDDRRLAVRYSDGIVRAAVDLILDDLGRISAIFASGRPRYEAGRFVERPWHGRFFDYRQHKGQWLLFQSIVDRTVTARTFAKLIKVEAVQALVKHHFTRAEVAAIEASVNR